MGNNWRGERGADAPRSPLFVFGQVLRARHAVDEVAALFAALPQADPRLRLLVELAAELRAGQAVRARRTDLTFG